MQRKALSLVVCAAAAVAAALPASGTAQSPKAIRYPYTLVDPGTLGGASTSFDGPGVPLTTTGTLLGASDTAAPRGQSPSCFCGPAVDPAFAWRDGRLADLGALPGDPSNSSAVWEINGAGVGAGGSTDGAGFDPLLGIVPTHAV